MIHFLILRCILMLSLVIAVAISASIIRAVSTLNESRLKPQYFTRILHSQHWEASLKGRE